MALFGDPVSFLSPLGPFQDLVLIPTPRVEQMHEQRPHLGHAHLGLFFPPTGTSAVRGTTGPVATEPCGGATRPNLASRTRPTHPLLWPLESSAPPTSGTRAP